MAIFSGVEGKPKTRHLEVIEPTLRSVGSKVADATMKLVILAVVTAKQKNPNITVDGILTVLAGDVANDLKKHFSDLDKEGASPRI
jgi:hypothetical protein